MDESIEKFILRFSDSKQFVHSFFYLSFLEILPEIIYLKREESKKANINKEDLPIDIISLSSKNVFSLLQNAYDFYKQWAIFKAPFVSSKIFGLCRKSATMLNDL